MWNEQLAGRYNRGEITQEEYITIYEQEKDMLKARCKKEPVQRPLDIPSQSIFGDMYAQSYITDRDAVDAIETATRRSQSQNQNPDETNDRYWRPSSGA